MATGNQHSNLHRGVVLLTLGRLPVALEIARAFHQQGWRVIVAEPLKRHLCSVSLRVSACHITCSPVAHPQLYQEQLLQIVTRESVDLIVPVSEESLHVSALRDRLPSGVRIACAQQNTLLRLHDKWQFIRWAREHSLSVPETVLASSNAVQQLIAKADYIVKPRLSCSGMGVVAGTANTLPCQSLRTDNHIVQLRLAAVACSSFAIAADGQCLAIVTYRARLESGSVAVCFESMQTPADIDRFNHEVIARSNYSGMISFDFMQGNAGHWQAIECNPRATSGLHFLPSRSLVAGLTAAAGLDSPAMCCTCVQAGLRRQEFWSSLTELEGRLFRGRFDRRLWKQLFTTRDISWSATDWKPCLLMPVIMAPTLWQAIIERKPITQLLMQDIGWYRRAGSRRQGAVTLEVSRSEQAPEGTVELLQAVSFGTHGLRYRRRDVARQLAHFHRPVFFSVRSAHQLSGIYIIDLRHLLIRNQPAKGFYRGALAVRPEQQGQGLGQALTDAALQWIEDIAAQDTTPVVSYGCIDKLNTRSLSLLYKQGAQPVADISLFMMYRQWPANKLPLTRLGDEDMPHHDALWRSTMGDCQVLDVTPRQTRPLAWVDERGIRIAATVTPSAYCIEALPAVPRWLTRLFVTPWAVARKRFDPEHFRFVVFSHVAIEPGAERYWPDFVSSVLAREAVHFGVLYPDTRSRLFNTVLRTGLWGRWVHSGSGSINIMMKVHSAPSLWTAQNRPEESRWSDPHGLYPVDG